MTRPRWQKIAVIIAGALAVVFLVFALVLIGSDPGMGEVSVILHGAGIVISLIAVAVFAAFALWFWFWRIRWIRWIGSICVAGVTLFVAFNVVVEKLEDWARAREAKIADAKAELIGDQYLARLIEEQPATADQARKLFEEFFFEHRAVPSKSGNGVSAGREFRAVWHIYYWTFFDPDFDVFTTYYPGDGDCALFLEAFGEKYAEVAPVPVFVERCERS
ncbi:MAG: hypothetical protein ABJN14_14550 [Paracoccaceae bacterium]